jgi:MTH538 TIR-like domain (DUF1863)
MADKIRNVFVSHVHADDDRISEMKSLLAVKGFSMRDYSITNDKPNQAKNEDYIKNQILAPQIKACSTMVVIITPKTAASSWVQWEIEYAAKNGIPIVGVYAHGDNGCKLPEGLEDYAKTIVGWNGDKIIDAIESDTPPPSEKPDGSPAPVRQVAKANC